MNNCCLILGILYIGLSSSNSVFSLTVGDSNLAFVVNAEEKPTARIKRELSQIENETVTKIYELNISSKITTRFANTIVTTKMINTGSTPQEAKFSVVIPEDAFISEFVMEIDGTFYTGYVVENQKARKQFDSALANQLGAGLLTASIFDSNIFVVSVNIEPYSKIAFYLTYQELLKRKFWRYEHVITINPGQLVENLRVEVAISEHKKIENLEASLLLLGNSIKSKDFEIDPKAKINKVKDFYAIVNFVPNITVQEELANYIKSVDRKKSLSAQFIVRYDVQRNNPGGEVLTRNGHFVHFFAPPAPPKHVVFVVATNSDMWGYKLTQLKQAMHSILNQLNEKDVFSLLEFSGSQRVWNLELSPDKNVWYKLDEEQNKNVKLQKAYSVNKNSIRLAMNAVDALVGDGFLDLTVALRTALQLVEMEKQYKTHEIDRQPVIIMLTDGKPKNLAQDISPESVIEEITALNTGLKKSSIVTLSIGRDAYREFLQKLSSLNLGFSQYIKPDSNPTSELQEFYKKISLPVLTNITYKYDSTEVRNVAEAHFPVFYDGTELIVTGQCSSKRVIAPPKISAQNFTGVVTMQSVVQYSSGDISRIWAYATVKNLLEKKKNCADNIEDINRQILDISLKYSFVTALTSMRITIPNKKVVIGTGKIDDNTGLIKFGNLQRLQSSNENAFQDFYEEFEELSINRRTAEEKENKFITDMLNQIAEPKQLEFKKAILRRQLAFLENEGKFTHTEL